MRLEYPNCAELNSDCPVITPKTFLRTQAMNRKALARLPANKANLWLPYVKHHLDPPYDNCRVRYKIPPKAYPDTRFLETTPSSLHDIPTTIQELFHPTTHSEFHSQ